MTKPKPKHLKKRAGRKWFDGQNEEVVLAKLKWAWDIGATDVEACAHADISVDGLQNYLTRHPELRLEKKMRKQKPILLARNTVEEAMRNKDAQTSRWYLERKRKQEFSTLTRTENVNTNIDLEAEKKELEELNKLGKKNAPPNS